MGKNQTKPRLKRNQSGFTIIEVMLFTSLSALFLLIAVIGGGPIQRNTQFTIAMEDLEQVIDDTASDLKNGLKQNPGSVDCRDVGVSGSNGGDNDGCVLIGKLINFGQPPSNEYIVYDVIADSSVIGSTQQLWDTSSGLKVVPSSAQVQPYKWGLTFNGSVRVNGDPDYIQNAWMIGLFFDPNATDNEFIVPAAYQNTSNPDHVLTGLLRSNYGAELSATFCFQDSNGNRTAGLHFAQRTEGANIEIDYNVDCSGAS